MIRRALEKDIDRIVELLNQVLMVHHNGRPDIFKAGTAKYTRDELEELIKDEKRPIFVYIDETTDVNKVLGYAFCIIKREENNNILTDIKTLYIDDLCVDENARGMQIGRSLYEYVLGYAKEISCYNITLNVWACNRSAMKFYEKMGLVPQKIGMEILL